MSRISGIRRIPTVLLIDDRRTNLLSLKLALEPEGYRLLLASSGAAGLGACRSDCVDLVVTDVLMPGLSGIEVAEKLRASSRTLSIPIVFLTAAPDDVRRFSQYDSDDVAVMSKPLDVPALKSTIRRLLDQADDPVFPLVSGSFAR